MDKVNILGQVFTQQRPTIQAQAPHGKSLELHRKPFDDMLGRATTERSRMVRRS